MFTWKPSISVVYPMYNEEENIAYAVQFAEAILQTISGDYEIIIVNDCSTDTSPKIAEDIARVNPRVRVVHNERNLKLGGTLRRGFSEARKELVFYCDSDLPVDLHELKRALTIMEFTRADIVSAYRFDRTAEGFVRTIYSIFYNLLIRVAFPIRVKDINFSFKLFKRSILDAIRLESRGSFIDAELLIRAKILGYKIVQFGADYFPRDRGISTLATPDVIVKMVLELITFRAKLWREQRARLPKA
jgi:glycosyltransferase involved in cell wall biosynthesis